MAYKPQKPKLVMDDVLTEIYNRTGAPINGIYQIIWTYNEIVKEAVTNGVEAPFGDICFFGFRDTEPHLSRDYYDVSLRKMVSGVPVDGWRKPDIRWNRQFVRDLRAKTRYAEGEQKPE